VADALGGAAVEAEDVLVEIGGQVLLADGTVVGTERPALGEAEDEMDGRQPEGGVAPGGAEIDRLVAVAGLGQAAAAGPAVGGDGRGLGDAGGEEAFQARGPGIGQLGEPEPTQAAASRLAAAGLDCPGDQGLAGGTAAAPAGPRAAEIGLVGLDMMGQGFAVGADHGLADFVQPGPGGAVTAQAQLPPQFGGGDPALAGRRQVGGEEPLGEAGLGLLEDRAGEQGVLLAAGHALVDDLGPECVGIVVATSYASKSIRPARLEQVLPALLVAAEPGQERWHVFRQIVGEHRYPTAHC
jgi:hypothetical protein